jgi:hypothetical protein
MLSTFMKDSSEVRSIILLEVRSNILKFAKLEILARNVDTLSHVSTLRSQTG